MFFPLLVLSGCTARTPNPEALLPQAASGWTRSGEVRRFEAGELWRYMDGGADPYVAAGVRRTATASYRHGDDLEAVADIHLFSSAEGAGKMMESEPAAGSQSVPIGDAARLFAQSLVFRRGPYLVHLVAYQDTPHNRTALTSLAQAIAAKM